MKRRLYVISSSLGLVKVGASASPAGRTIDLQYQRNDKLSLVWESEPLENSNITIEKYAHKLLKEYRQKGEWFSCSIELAISAANKAIAECKPKSKDVFNRICVSLYDGDMEKLVAIKSIIEAKTGKRHSLSKIVRLAIETACDSEGVK